MTAAATSLAQSMARPSTHLCRAAVVLSALLFAGCGAENPAMLSESDAARLTTTVEGIGEAVDDGACETALERVQRFSVQVGSLPPTVDEDLRERLAQGAEHLEGQVPEDCAEAVETPTAPETPDVTPVPTEPPPPVETPAPTTTPSPVPDETPTVQPDDGGGVPEGDGGGDDAVREGAGVREGNGKEEVQG